MLHAKHYKAYNVKHFIAQYTKIITATTTSTFRWRCAVQCDAPKNKISVSGNNYDKNENLDATITIIHTSNTR